MGRRRPAWLRLIDPEPWRRQRRSGTPPPASAGWTAFAFLLFGGFVMVVALGVCSRRSADEPLRGVQFAAMAASPSPSPAEGNRAADAGHPGAHEAHRPHRGHGAQHVPHARDAGPDGTPELAPSRSQPRAAVTTAAAFKSGGTTAATGPTCMPTHGVVSRDQAAWLVGAAQGLDAGNFLTSARPDGPPSEPAT